MFYNAKQLKLNHLINWIDFYSLSCNNKCITRSVRNLFILMISDFSQNKSTLFVNRHLLLLSGAGVGISFWAEEDFVDVELREEGRQQLTVAPRVRLLSATVEMKVEIICLICLFLLYIHSTSATITNDSSSIMTRLQQNYSLFSSQPKICQFHTHSSFRICLILRTFQLTVNFQY